MILVDSSVWVDHLRAANATLAALLNRNQVLGHSFVTGELSLGSLHRRETILDLLRDLPQARVATDSEVLAFVDARALFGLGIGYVDAQLLASVRLTPGASLWTGDKRLLAVASRLSLAMPPGH